MSEEESPHYRTVRQHTGAEFEGNLANRNRGEQVPGVQAVDSRDQSTPESQRSGQQGSSTARSPVGIASFFNSPRPKDNVVLVGAPGRKRPKKVAESRTVNYNGKALTVFKGTSAAEDAGVAGRTAGGRRAPPAPHLYGARGGGREGAQWR